MNEQMQQLMLALVGIIVSSEAFKTALATAVEEAVSEQAEDTITKDALTEAMNNHIENYDFSDIVKSNVADMSFDVSVSRY